MYKIIHGFDGKYSISDDGKVFSHKRAIHIKPLNHSRGYSYVHLYINGKKVFKYIHRLVAEAFIGDIKNIQINHKDGNKKNNNILNLEIVTSKENQRHAIENGLFRKMIRSGKGTFVSY